VRSTVPPRYEVSTSEIVLPATDDHLADQSPPLPVPLSTSAATTTTQSGGNFNAVKRIAPPPLERLDDSWRMKVERDRKLSKKRHRRERFMERLLLSSAASKFRKVGIAVISCILVATFFLLFINHRLGGVLLKSVFGQ
jgi:hypothetical protein